MQLINTIKVNFGNEALAAWEQECEKINAANDATRNNPVYEEIEGWEAREIFDAKWSEDGKERISDYVNIIKNSFDSRTLGLDFSTLPQESVARVKNYLVEKKLIKVAQKVKLQELTTKPETSTPWKEVLKLNPKLSYSYRNGGYRDFYSEKTESGEAYKSIRYVYYDKVKKIDLSNIDKTDIFSATKHYIFHQYNVFHDRIEIMEGIVTETKLWTNGSEFHYPRRSWESSIGGGDQDGFLSPGYD